MPGTVLLGRHVRVATDALALPALCTALWRAVWSGVVLGLFLHLQYLLRSCSRPGLIWAFVCLALVLFLAMALVELAIAFFSRRGTIVQVHVRKPVSQLLVMHTMLGLAQVLVALLGLAILAAPSRLAMCSDVDIQGRVFLVVAVTTISVLADLAAKCCCGVLLVGPPTREGELPVFEQHPDDVVIEERWRTRCSLLCTCLKYSTCWMFSGRGGRGAGEGIGDLEVVARVLADVFHSEGFIDVLPSDLVAGFVLLRHVQKAQEEELIGRSDSEGHIVSINQMHLRETEGLEFGGARAREAMRAAGGDTAPAPPGSSGSGSASGSTALLGGRQPTALDMLGSLRAQRVRFQSGHYLATGPFSSRVLRADNPEDRRVLEEGAYFGEYALAVYSWMMFLYANMPCGAMPLLTRMCCKLPPKRGRVNEGRQYGGTEGPAQSGEALVLGDNCMRAHEAALRQFLVNKHCELVYVAFTNSLYERPYAILVDHKWQSVIIAIRGTLSWEDLLVDANASAVPVDEVGRIWGFPGEGKYAHGGILDAAVSIAKDLESHQLVHNLMRTGRTDGSPQASPYTPLTKSAKGYSLRVVGHSLGAGAAIVLALMLRRDFPDLKCLAFAPPGGLISPNLADLTTSFTTSFVVGRDIVPRLSIFALHKVREDLLRLLTRCKVNKLEVLGSIFEKDSSRAVQRLLHPPECTPNSNFLSQLQAYEEHRRQVERRLHVTELVPGGRIVHFVKSHVISGGFCRGSRQGYTPCWTTLEQLQEITVSTSMLADHVPDRVVWAMTSVCREHDIRWM